MQHDAHSQKKKAKINLTKVQNFFGKKNQETIKRRKKK